ncbi:MAG: hypothetical protein SPL19_11220 [Fibrobacter sp.]|nr:hypothetical protein [Fibrobacter sp.]MDY6368412.1 hypothetical protein [Fibrobacter sp.]MDY6390916.1 hypothetical protein [Fibrobacter sp.]
MKKIFILMVFATMFIACADNNVCVAPEYTQPTQDTTAVQDTTFEPVYDTTDTTTYKLEIGSVCTDMNVQSTGILTDAEARLFDGTWWDKCYLSSGYELYIAGNYKLDKVVTILMDNLSFDSNMVNSLLTEVNNSEAIVYIYNTNSGLNFLYIRRLIEY